MVFGLQTQPKSWLTGYTFWVNHYLEIVFSKIIVVNPPPPLKEVKNGNLLKLAQTRRSPAFDLASHHLREESVLYQRRLIVPLRQLVGPLAAVGDEGANVEHFVRQVQR